ncbi:hypothetical protein EI067_13530 [Mycobacterium paragordonae]|uniref:hypothetical protein n=1 Tax=Mycobacterium paragordonae TaxID=1389713 RepID=UPI0010615A93|nr:hypothetical protein [Mycobacterium paragordonae]TDK97027.1 hypothetical protein EI067_13530 [Mycobacterium paragordonae]
MRGQPILANLMWANFFRAVGATLATLALAGCGSTPSKPTVAPFTIITGPSSTTTTTTTSRDQTGAGLPPMKHFRIGGDSYGPVQDCHVADTAVTCTASWDRPYQADTYTGSFTGTLSGFTMTGTWTTHQTGHDANDPRCLWQTDTSVPTTFQFSLDGTVVDHSGPGQWRTTRSGSCTGQESGTSSAAEGGPTAWKVLD